MKLKKRKATTNPKKEKLATILEAFKVIYEECDEDEEKAKEMFSTYVNLYKKV